MEKILKAACGFCNDAHLWKCVHKRTRVCPLICIVPTRPVFCETSYAIAGHPT